MLAISQYISAPYTRDSRWFALVYSFVENLFDIFCHRHWLATGIPWPTRVLGLCSQDVANTFTPSYRIICFIIYRRLGFIHISRESEIFRLIFHEETLFGKYLLAIELFASSISYLLFFFFLFFFYRTWYLHQQHYYCKHLDSNWAWSLWFALCKNQSIFIALLQIYYKNLIQLRAK